MTDPAVGWPLTTAQGELVATLASLVRRGGAARFTEARVIAADKRDFPDAWDSTLVGLHRLLYRLAWLAHFDIEIAINDIRPPKPPDDRMLKSSEVELLSAVGEKATFDVAALGNDDIAGRCAHAIGDAYIALAPIDPFRDAAREITTAEASVAAVYLGLGVLVANSSMYRRFATRRTGNSVSTQDFVEQVGGLSIGEATLLVAVQDAVRDEHSPALATLLPPQLEWLERWRVALDDHEDELRALLGLDDAAAAAPLSRPAAPRTPPAAVERDLKKFNLGRKTFRVETRGLGRMGLGFMGGAVAFAIPGVGLIAGPVAMVAGAIGGYLGATRYFVCSDPACRTHMQSALAECPYCGGTILETIKHASLRLDRLEAFEDEATDESATEV